MNRSDKFTGKIIHIYKDGLLVDIYRKRINEEIIERNKHIKKMFADLREKGIKVEDALYEIHKTFPVSVETARKIVYEK